MYCRYLNHDDTENFFSTAQRALIVNHILNKTPYFRDDEEVRLGINRLLRNRTYIDAFPLHEVNYFIFLPFASLVVYNASIKAC